ncbi:hypothetical protein HK097_008408 [Rhizophlyctis rosea]|uniref:Uncharacterized protein n=1 Tax=Rhizophlyctis rosea TaxID=64517 RepID=A0AAD5SCK3_9FUNG|nr:hypothetical protein HK097_008408 [Rhizophlyctis rosea]
MKQAVLQPAGLLNRLVTQHIDPDEADAHIERLIIASWEANPASLHGVTYKANEYNPQSPVGCFHIRYQLPDGTLQAAYGRIEFPANINVTVKGDVISFLRNGYWRRGADWEIRRIKDVKVRADQNDTFRISKLHVVWEASKATVEGIPIVIRWLPTWIEAHDYVAMNQL